MAKLILSLEGSVIREIPIDKERVTIGRKASNDIQIDNLAVSGEHARIVTILDDSFLEDTGSTNGTLVNGNLIKKHILQNNDLIEIGKYKLKFVNDGPVASQAVAEDSERTMVLRRPMSGTIPPTPPAAASKPAAAPIPAPTPAPTPASRPAPAPVAESKPAPAPAPAPMATPRPAPTPAMAATPVAPQQAFIQIMSGPGAGKELPLTKSLTTLGKPGVQVAVITRRPQGYFITHVEGALFPSLNGRVLDNQAHALGDNDMIEIAGVKMAFLLRT